MLIEDPFDKDHPKNYRVSTTNLSDFINIVEIGHNRIPPGLKQTMLRDVYILHYVVNGKGNFLGTPFDHTCGFIVYPHELEIVEADIHTPHETYWIMLRGNVKQLFSSCGFPTHNSVFSFPRTEECAEILHRALYESEVKDELSEAAMMLSAFYSLLALHLEKMPSKSQRNRTEDLLKRFIDENYYKQIRIDTLAKRYGFTRNYLSFLFKKAYGVSPQEYLLDLRIKKAKELLTDFSKELSVGEIAYAIGFSDPLYFSRVFHKKAGVSPTRYRVSKTSEAE